MNAPSQIKAAHRYTLTPEDFDLCDRFNDLLKRMLTGPVTHVSVSRHGNDDMSGLEFGDAMAHAKLQAFSSGLEPVSLGAKLQSALDQAHAQNPSEEERKAKRIAELNAELASLTGEQVAA